MGTAKLAKNSKAQKEELAFYGFNRSFWARYGPAISVLVIIVSSIAFGIISYLLNLGVNSIDVSTGAVALGAFALAYQQWHAAREEISLDKFYDRLDRANRLLDIFPSSRELMNPEWSKDRSGAAYERTMYVFMELDNLEYAIEKYRLGYMSSGNAFRALSTFKSRCNKASKFRNFVLPCVQHFGYNATTIEVVKKVVNFPERKA